MNYNLELGRKEGIKTFIEIYQEDKFSKEETAARLIRKFCLSPKEAQEFLEKYWAH